MTDIGDRFESTGAGIGVERRGGGESDISAIRADIRATRERMGNTMEDIGQRLNANRLKQRVKDNLHDATIGKAENMARRAAHRVDDTRTSIMTHVRDNPIPVALVGVGLGWLLVNARRGEEEETRVSERWTEEYGPYEEFYPPHPDGGEGAERGAAERLSEATHRTRERGEELADRARDRVTDIAHEARDVVTDATDRTRERLDQATERARTIASGLARETRNRGNRVEDRFEEALNENPLAVGAAAMALGMAVGLATPGTRREDEMLGGVRDRLVDRAKETAKTTVEETAQKVRETAERVGQSGESGLGATGRETEMI